MKGAQRIGRASVAISYVEAEPGDAHTPYVRSGSPSLDNRSPIRTAGDPNVCPHGSSPDGHLPLIPESPASPIGSAYAGPIQWIIRLIVESRCSIDSPVSASYNTECVLMITLSHRTAVRRFRTTLLSS